MEQCVQNSVKTEHEPQILNSTQLKGEAKLKIKTCKDSTYVFTHLESQHFGRQRQADHLSSGVQDQLGQHGATLSLPKTHTKVSWVWR